MTKGRQDGPRATRRGFLGATAGLAAAASASLARRAHALEATPATAIEPFYGAHQSGIVTPAQAHTYFAAFDLTTTKREDLVKLLRKWTEAAALLTRRDRRRELRSARPGAERDRLAARQQAALASIEAAAA